MKNRQVGYVRRNELGRTIDRGFSSKPDKLKTAEELAASRGYTVRYEPVLPNQDTPRMRDPFNRPVDGSPRQSRYDNWNRDPAVDRWRSPPPRRNDCGGGDCCSRKRSCNCCSCDSNNYSNNYDNNYNNNNCNGRQCSNFPRINERDQGSISYRAPPQDNYQQQGSTSYRAPPNNVTMVRAPLKGNDAPFSLGGKFEANPDFIGATDDPFSPRKF